jgi:hypothetical protein
MSPVLRKASPRATSAAISAAAGYRLGRDCVACGEIVGDVVGGVACFLTEQAKKRRMVALLALARSGPEQQWQEPKSIAGLSNLLPGQAQRPAVSAVVSARPSPSRRLVAGRK